MTQSSWDIWGIGILVRDWVEEEKPKEIIKDACPLVLKLGHAMLWAHGFISHHFIRFNFPQCTRYYF